MPYIVMKRDDIPRGALQILDLLPNISQRVASIDPPGQNKYINPIVNDTVVLTGAGPITSYVTSRGLASWFVTNVNDGTGALATGSFAITAGNAAPGDEVVVDASALGGPSVTFTFVAGAPVLDTDVTVGVDEDTSASNLAATINLVVNGLVPYVTAAAPGGGPPSPVDLTAVSVGVGGNTIAISKTGANITVSGATLTGGVDADALTAAQANTIAANILDDLIRYGDLTLPAVDADLTTVNNLIAAVVPTATNALDATQLMEIFDILTGRVYILPKGVQIDLDGSTFLVDPPVGAAGGPGFVDETFVRTFNTGAFMISFGEGEMYGFRQTGFTYRDVGGAHGEAIAVYNDDGTLYTL